MLQHAEKTVISLKPEQRQARKNERIRRNFDCIRRHREAFLAKRNNSPLPIDAVALLEQIRDEHDEHAFALLTERE